MNSLPSEPHLYNSPKRKRGESAPGDTLRTPSASPSRPRLVTDPRKFAVSHVGSPDDDRGDGSPRSTVAGQFQTLAIQGASKVDRRDAGHARKRLALMSEVESPGTATEQRFRPPTADTFKFESPSPPVISERPRGHTRSPPLDGDPHDLFWHESEITGHNPDDPNDDGYGINGIGFKATPATAWARSQKRKQQLAEYKSRETREARQRRSERRKIRTEDEIPVQGNLDRVNAKTSRVRFEDG